MNAAIIDYGYGNLFSLKKALAHLGATATIAHSPRMLADARILFLPGVGAFGDGISELRRRGFEKPLLKHAKNGKPLFGICLGMQFLFDTSEEFGRHKGLGLISGVVKRIAPIALNCKIPQVGWNALQVPKGATNWKGTILEKVKPSSDQVYFVHSYAGNPSHQKDVLAETEYCGVRMTAVVKKGSLYGTQFHPEKSGTVGLTILKNFLDNNS